MNRYCRGAVLPRLVLVVALALSGVAAAQSDGGAEVVPSSAPGTSDVASPAPGSDASAAAVQAAAQGIADAASALGIEVAPEVIGAYAAFLVDGLTQRKLKDALAAGEGAAARIATQDDAERVWLDAPVPERPGASIKLNAGDVAPWRGQLNAPDEEVRRARGYVDVATTLKVENTDGVVMPKPIFWGMVGVGAAAIAASIALGAACAASPDCLKARPK